ncbi:MAG: type II secretion system protein [Candidatus Anstonellaceae archaeon]
MKAQLSAEMLIVLVVILGVAVLVASVMIRSANKAAEKVEQKAEALFNATDTSLKGATGAYCVSDSDCASGICNTLTNKCS